MKSLSYTHTIKPLFDFMGALIFILMFSWVLILIGLIYLLTFQLPILFAQTRLGRSGNAFTMWKFRTLSVKEDKSLQQRRFVLGDVLRKFSIDELPQLWNVLTGEMSMVGPRPLPAEYIPYFSDEQLLRFSVKPGITGWAQVNGRHSISWQEKLALDNYYVNHISLKLDLIILFKTFVLLLSFKKDRSLEEEKFNGIN